MSDLIFYNAKIVTMDSQSTIQQSIAIKGNMVFAIGKNDEILRLAGRSTKKIDLGGNLILPGFIDSHLHILAGGERLFHPDLRNAKSKEEFISIIKNNLKRYKPGEWILGGGWNNENWGGKLPTKDWIDEITPQNPVWIKRLDGHMVLVNSLALKIADIDDGVKEVPGGEIFRKNGKLTGIFMDNAMVLIEEKVPKANQEQKGEYLKAAMNYLAERGVTSVHHLNLFESTDNEFFENFKQSRNLLTRIYLSFPLKMNDLEFHSSLRLGKGDEWIKYGIYKGFLDGSLGSQTALFFEPYLDTKKQGLYINEVEELEYYVKRADKNNVQLAIHAIGDKANHELLNIYERIIKENGKRDRRFRIEHVQHLQKKDVDRFKELDIIASMQPLHLCDDGSWSHKIIGNEAGKGSYNFNSLLKAGTKLAFGSDWFVSEPSPILGIDAAVNRHTSDGKNESGWLPEEKIAVDEAVKSYTINGAFASFDEKEKGSLKPRKLADLVVLDQDIFTIDPLSIKETKVLATMVGGRLVFDKL